MTQRQELLVGVVHLRRLAGLGIDGQVRRLVPAHCPVKGPGHRNLFLQLGELLVLTVVEQVVHHGHIAHRVGLDVHLLEVVGVLELDDYVFDPLSLEVVVGVPAVLKVNLDQGIDCPLRDPPLESDLAIGGDVGHDGGLADAGLHDVIDHVLLGVGTAPEAVEEDGRGGRLDVAVGQRLGVARARGNQHHQEG